MKRILIQNQLCEMEGNILGKLGTREEIVKVLSSGINDDTTDASYAVINRDTKSFHFYEKEKNKDEDRESCNKPNDVDGVKAQPFNCNPRQVTPIIIFVKSRFDKSNTPALVTEGIDPITGKYVRYDGTMFDQFCDTPRCEPEVRDVLDTTVSEKQRLRCDSGDKNYASNQTIVQEHKRSDTKKNNNGDLEVEEFTKMDDSDALLIEGELRKSCRIKLTPLPVRTKPRATLQTKAPRNRAQRLERRPVEVISTKEFGSSENMSVTLEDLDSGPQSMKAHSSKAKPNDWNTRKINYTMSQGELKSDAVRDVCSRTNTLEHDERRNSAEENEMIDDSDLCF